MVRLRINAAAADINHLSVKADAELLMHDSVTPGSGDARKVIKKEATGNSASVAFQSGFSERAKIGLSVAQYIPSLVQQTWRFDASRPSTPRAYTLGTVSSAILTLNTVMVEEI
ncbi:MAG: hypothetical protein V7741_12720 [Hyphomonas sp.]